MVTIEDIRRLPALDAASIHVWGVHIPDLMDRLDGLSATLCEKEREKAARFHRDCDRHSSIAARGALRILLSVYTGIPAGDIAFQYSENGKPFLVPPTGQAVPQASCLLSAEQQGRQDACDTVAFNVSHSGDWVVLVFGRNRNIGVDVEMIRREMDVMAIASRYFTPEETALIERAEEQHAMFFKLWARKEAYVKASGSSLFRELSSFAVPIEDGEKDGWIFRQLDAGSKYAAAVVTDKPVQDMPCYDFGGLKWDS